MTALRDTGVDSLTVRDLLLPGEPLDPAEVVAGQAGLGNAVSWVVSLRPFAPAFPRLRGSELALVATEFVARLDPPTTLADVVRQLVAREAAGMAVRGEIDAGALDAAENASLPVIRLLHDLPLPDLEQAIMRACALYQARREILPAEEPDTWVEDLLSGSVSSVAEAQQAARRQGHTAATHYSVALVPPPEGREDTAHALEELAARIRRLGKGVGPEPLVQPWEGGLVALLPPGSADRALALAERAAVAAGMGSEMPLLDAPLSLGEARLAALASSRLYERRPARYSALGADRLLLMMLRDNPAELSKFVDESLGPLLRHDASSPTALLPTLESFLGHGGRLRDTAAAIFVHRNTLAYRLDRAAETLRADLRDPQVRLTLEVALRAARLLGVTGRGE